MEPSFGALVNLGEGNRCCAFLGVAGERNVVVKVYHEAAVEKYRRRFGVEIADFEYKRNLSFFEIDELRPYVAEPIGVTDFNGRRAFIQQHIPGQELEAYLIEHGRIPVGLLDTARTLIRKANRAGLFDIDINANNVILRIQDGSLMPTLFDFNLVPQHEHPPNPLCAFALVTGLRKKSHRDYRTLIDWQRIAAQSAGIDPTVRADQFPHQSRALPNPE